MPKKFSVDSTNEFINIIRTQENGNIMASLDIVSLFTNVPVNETIEIILNYMYRNTSLPPCEIPERYMRELLLICTTETPFTCPNGTLYKQVDGVSMGCVLGPTFANYYMGHLEEITFRNHSVPRTYCRYVDDIFVIIRTK